MPERTGSIVAYAKVASFEIDEDGMVHAVFETPSMQIRIIQTRANFFLSAESAQVLGKRLAADQGAQILKIALAKGRPAGH